MTGINKFVVLVILSVFDSSKSLVKLPSVKDNDISKTEVAIRTTLNNLFSLLQLRGSPENSKIKQYTTVHNFFVSETLQDYDTLKEIAKLTRVDKSTLQNVTTDFIAVLNEGISSNYFSKTSSPNTDDLNNLEDEIQRLQNMKHLYASPKEYSKINKEVLKILEHRDEKVTNVTEESKAVNDIENKVLKNLGNIIRLLGESDIWIPDSPNKTRRIYQGKLAHEKHFPFLASVEIFKKFHCGASIIQSDLLITAASCIQLAWNNRYYRENPLFLQVRVGSKFIQVGGETIPISEIYFYPTYNPRTLQHNIAVMRTVRQMNLRIHDNYKVKRIELDKKDHRMPETEEVLVLGWGAHTSSNLIHSPLEAHLRKYYIPVYGLEECQEVYTKNYVTSTNFCAGYISGGTGGACNRDAGGPGVFNGYLVGVISFGSPVCGAPDTPTVFTKIGHYYDWIEGIIEMKVPFSMKSTTKQWKNSFYSEFVSSHVLWGNESVKPWYITPVAEIITFGLADYHIVRNTTKNLAKLNSTVLINVSYPSSIIQSTKQPYLLSEIDNPTLETITEVTGYSEATYNLNTPDNYDYESFNQKEKAPMQIETEKAPMQIETEKAPMQIETEKAPMKIETEKPKIESKQEQLIMFKKFLKSIFENEDEVREYLNLLNMSDVYHNESGINMVHSLLKTGSTDSMQKNNNFYDEKTDDIKTGEVAIPYDSKSAESLAESFESRFKNAKGTIKYYEDEIINDSGTFSKSHEKRENSPEHLSESKEKGLRSIHSKLYTKHDMLSDVSIEPYEKIHKKYTKTSVKYKQDYKLSERTSQLTGKHVRTPKTLPKSYKKVVTDSEKTSESNETYSESDDIETTLPKYEIKTSRTTHKHTEFVTKHYTKKRTITKAMHKTTMTPTQTKSSGSSSEEREIVKILEDISRLKNVSPLYPIQNDTNKTLRDLLKQSKKDNWIKEMDVEIPETEYVKIPETEFEIVEYSTKKHVLELKKQKKIEGKESLYEYDLDMTIPTTPYHENNIFKMYFENFATSETPKIKKYKIKNLLTTKRTHRYKIEPSKKSQFLKAFDDSLITNLDQVAYEKDKTKISIDEQNRFFDQAAQNEMYSAIDTVGNKVGIEKKTFKEQTSKYEKGFKQILFDIVEKVFDGM